jgi:pimeloyl-ACP methyl ester carboxylesterase
MSQTTSAGGPLTVVLVHGAFADASSWTGVIQRLQARGVRVTAVANPLRGISIDSAYVASMFEQIPGPVLAVGHSYGGAVITNAATGAKNVVGLVYMAAFAPDEGERLGEVEASSKDSVLNSALVALKYPTGQGSDSGGRVRHRSRQGPTRRCGYHRGEGIARDHDLAATGRHRGDRSCHRPGRLSGGGREEILRRLQQIDGLAS